MTRTVCSDHPAEPPRRFSAAWRLTSAVLAVGASTQLASAYVAIDRVGVDEDVWKPVAVLVGVAAIVVHHRRSTHAALPGEPARYTPVTAATSIALAIVIASIATVVATQIAAIAFDPGNGRRPPGSTDRVEAWELFQTAAFAPVVEEALFRAGLLGLVVAIASARSAIVVQALAFAVAHTTLGYAAVGFDITGDPYNTTTAVGMFISGLLYGYLAVEFGTVWVPLVVHGAHNAAIEVGATTSAALWLYVAIVGAFAIAAVFRGLFGLVDPERMEAGADTRLGTWAEPHCRRWANTQSPELRRPRDWLTSTPFVPQRTSV
ncbi:MAG: CPBP family intramembrane glutamic endopeptidase [Actinomycetota bacterium]